MGRAAPVPAPVAVRPLPSFEGVDMALTCGVGVVVSVRVCVCMHNLEEGCEENGAQSEK